MESRREALGRRLTLRWLWLGIVLLGPLAGRAQAAIELTVDASVRGPLIPSDYIGLSFETSNLLPDANGTYFFSASNAPLVQLFKNIGVRNLRLGGGTVDMARYAVPNERDIDHLFAFAQAADVQVIYSFRLLHGNKSRSAALAKYIWTKYRPHLASFAIGNEPDWKSYHTQDPKITDYPSYLADWNDFASAIMDAVPDAPLAGPDSGSDYPVAGARDTRYRGISWTQRFAEDERRSGRLAAILLHDYVGQDAKGVAPSVAIKSMLSQDWVTIQYPALYENVLAGLVADGQPFRMTECNDYTGGVNDASNAFAAALWALDYLHWWAAHGCAGVNFHNRRWIVTDTIYLDRGGNLRVNPKACALRAFTLGARGRIIKRMEAANAEGANFSSYAVAGSTNMFVTVINKSCGAGGASITAVIRLRHFSASQGECIRLEAVPSGDCSARVATLGGVAITSSGPFHANWTPLTPDRHGQWTITLNPASAAVVHLIQNDPKNGRPPFDHESKD